MKTLILFTIMFFGSFAVHAQKTIETNTFTASMVPETVKTNFSKEFPGIQPKWEADLKNYKAVYADPKTNSKGIITYDADGKVIKRERVANTVKSSNNP